MIIIVIPLGGRISYIIVERRYSRLGSSIHICKVQLNVVFFVFFVFVISYNLRTRYNCECE